MPKKPKDSIASLMGKFRNAIIHDDTDGLNDILIPLMHLFNKEASVLDENKKKDYYTEFLRMPVQANALNVVQFLIDHGADINVSESDSSFLHRALHYRYLDMAFLLMDAGANVSILGNDNLTPLQVEIKKGCDVSVIYKMIEKGADKSIESEKLPLNFSKEVENLKCLFEACEWAQKKEISPELLPRNVDFREYIQNYRAFRETLEQQEKLQKEERDKRRVKRRVAILRKRKPKKPFQFKRP